jgi:hypothetical protein
MATTRTRWNANRKLGEKEKPPIAEFTTPVLILSLGCRSKAALAAQHRLTLYELMWSMFPGALANILIDF